MSRNFTCVYECVNKIKTIYRCFASVEKVKTCSAFMYAFSELQQLVENRVYKIFDRNFIKQLVIKPSFFSSSHPPVHPS